MRCCVRCRDEYEKSLIISQILLSRSFPNVNKFDLDLKSRAPSSSLNSAPDQVSSPLGALFLGFEGARLDQLQGHSSHSTFLACILCNRGSSLFWFTGAIEETGKVQHALCQLIALKGPMLCVHPHPSLHNSLPRPQGLDTAVLPEGRYRTRALCFEKSHKSL